MTHLILDHLPQIGAAVTPILLGALHLLSRRDRRTQTKELREPIADVHVLLNGRMDQALERIAALEDALRQHIETTDLALTATRKWRDDQRDQT